jgi:hypothetical protein
MTTALSIVSTTFEGAERNKALAIWGMLGALGATGGYLIGGPLVDASVAPARIPP